ncbi:cell division protein ZapA [Candidatus Dependentiae bacterium]|nr:cell division protein ZapA [Candidatus Dependentiae bacterium]
MSENRKPYKVIIAGEVYSLVSDETEESVTRAARLVDERVARVLPAIPSKDLKRATVLVALQLASELLEKENQKDVDSRRVQALAQAVEAIRGGSEVL